MFYSEFVLSKKSPLGSVWLAAHWNKKLTTAMVQRSDVVEYCNSIAAPSVPIALRTSGHLLLGVVRIHDSKQKALLSDCSNALVKIKVAFRPGTVDLPAGSAVAAFNAVTLQETITDFDTSFPENIDEFDESLLGTVARKQDITLADESFIMRGEHEGLHGDNYGDGEIVPFFDVERRKMTASGYRHISFILI